MRGFLIELSSVVVIAKKDCIPAAVYAAIVNVVGLCSACVGGGLIQATSG
jgi:hypothetical protein